MGTGGTPERSRFSGPEGFHTTCRKYLQLHGGSSCNQDLTRMFCSRFQISPKTATTTYAGASDALAAEAAASTSSTIAAGEQSRLAKVSHQARRCKEAALVLGRVRS